jgi:hypothetical protein
MQPATPPATPPPSGRSDAGTWTAFLVIAFGVVGLVGAFSTYAAQIPFDRAMVRLHAIDQAVAAAQAPDSADREAALKPFLDDSADRLLSGAGTMESRAAAERRRVLEDFHSQSADYGLRLRVVIAAFTGAAALFAALILSVARNQKGPA